MASTSFSCILSSDSCRCSSLRLTPVAFKQHVVIFGWTNRTLPLLRELVGSERAREQFQIGFGIRRLRVVVLSEDVSPAQAQALRDDSGLGRLARRVILRYGSPLEEEAIRRAGCLNAAVVSSCRKRGTSG